MSSGARKLMRVQLQEGSETHSRVADGGNDGVTQRELRDALAELFRTARHEARWFPSNDRLVVKAFGHAVAEISREIKSFTGAGIAQEGNILRKVFRSSTGREFRLDVENFGGPNLAIVEAPN